MPNQDYLTVIRETEAKAEAMIAAAQAESRQALEEARAEAARRVAAARTESEALQQQMLREAAAQSDSQAQMTVDAAGREAGQIRTAAASAMDAAVRIVAERIVK